MPFHKEEREQVRERLYTDRAVYRPGQTVYVGGLCYNERQAESHTVQGRKVVLELHDPNGKAVAEQKVESDAFGTFSGTFTLPTTGLSGRYFIRTEWGHTDFRVEEYKRPTFEVHLDEVGEHFVPGDTVSLTGMAMNYNGGSLAACTGVGHTFVVRALYRVVDGEKELPLDTVYTGEDGQFMLRVPVRETEESWGSWGLRQMVEVSVTSASGETQSAKIGFPLTRRDWNLRWRGHYRA